MSAVDRQLRIVEAILFASPTPVEDAALRAALPEDADLAEIMERLARDYEDRGVNLVRVAGGFAFRTAPDLAGALSAGRETLRKPSRAALETLAIIAYHQPVTRAEIESIRGVATAKGTLDVLVEAGWVRPGRRRQTPGRPLTWITTRAFLDHFDLVSLDELPGVEEMRAAGLLDRRPAIATIPGGPLETLDPVNDDADGDEDDPGNLAGADDEDGGSRKG